MATAQAVGSGQWAVSLIYQYLNAIDSSVTDQILCSSVNDQYWNPIGLSVNYQYWNPIGLSVKDQYWNPGGLSVNDQYWNLTGLSLNDEYWNPVGLNVIYQ